MLLIVWCTSASAEIESRVYFLDIGQGDATILHEPGQCTALIDAGPPINGYRITKKLHELAITALDMVIITHPHLDHYGGLFDIAPRITIKRLYDNGVIDTAPVFTDNYLPLKKTIAHETLRSGDNLQCGNFRLATLHPEQTGRSGTDYNAESLVLMVTADHFKLLIMGDVAGKAEQSLVEKSQGLKADILRIGHHGAGDATSENLLNTVQPTCAVISTGIDNRIGSPSPTVISHLEKKGIPFFRTDRDGTITVSQDGRCRRQ